MQAAGSVEYFLEIGMAVFNLVFMGQMTEREDCL